MTLLQEIKQKYQDNLNKISDSDNKRIKIALDKAVTHEKSEVLFLDSIAKVANWLTAEGFTVEFAKNSEYGMYLIISGWVETTIMGNLKISFLNAAKNSSNVSFIPFDMDTGIEGCPTRYGRNCFDEYVIINARFDDGTQVIHPPIILNQLCYDVLKMYNISTND